MAGQMEALMVGSWANCSVDRTAEILGWKLVGQKAVCWACGWDNSSAVCLDG